MFERNIYNRIAGFLTGAPMLVSYTHYRFQHLHHHRFIGTDKDKELFDYDPKSLRNPVTFVLRGLNLWRVPRFFMTLFEHVARALSRGVHDRYASSRCTDRI